MIMITAVITYPNSSRSADCTSQTKTRCVFAQERLALLRETLCGMAPADSRHLWPMLAAVPVLFRLENCQSRQNKAVLKQL
jgi:hypothetical protein